MLRYELQPLPVTQYPPLGRNKKVYQTNYCSSTRFLIVKNGIYSLSMLKYCDVSQSLQPYPWWNPISIQVHPCVRVLIITCTREISFGNNTKSLLWMTFQEIGKLKGYVEFSGFIHPFTWRLFHRSGGFMTAFPLLSVYWNQAILKLMRLPHKMFNVPSCLLNQIEQTQRKKMFSIIQSRHVKAFD